MPFGLLEREMRIIIVSVLIAIALVYKVESLTFCDDKKCACLHKEQSLVISCSSNPTVLDANYSLIDNVTTLDLSENNLTRIQKPLVSDTLIELLLYSNQIEEIAVNTLRLPSLKILDLSHNNLKFLHRDTFEQIKKLEHLNITNNKFAAFGSISFYHLKKLHEIVFDDNNIGSCFENYSLFDTGFDLTSEIQSISLRNANLTNNNFMSFIASDNIKRLILSQNSLTYMIDLPNNLEYLDLSNNPINTIKPNVFIFTYYLKVIKLNNILIEEVPDKAFYFLSLRELHLQNNRNLKRFSPSALGSVRDQRHFTLEYLTLRGSNLTSLDVQLAGIFQKINRVDLRDNPWNCDLKIAWLQNIDISEEFMDFRCSTPTNFHDKRVLELNTTELVCAELKHLEDFFVNIGIVTFCVLLTFAVLMMYFFIFSPKPLMYRQLPLEFPWTP